jgi:uncharacterized DUF497 family protein
MAGIRFEWDETKNLSNRRKHGVSSEEACQVFRDPLCVSVQDRIEGGELRWQTLGLVEGILLLTVAHTVREEVEHGTWVEVVRINSRIISARRATRKERRRYEDENG